MSKKILMRVLTENMMKIHYFYFFDISIEGSRSQIILLKKSLSSNKYSDIDLFRYYVEVLLE